MKRVAIIALVVLTVSTLFSFALAGDLSKLKARLADALNKQEYTTAASVIVELGEENSLEAAKIIISVALNPKIESQDVFKAAKEALSSITDEKAIKFICDSAKKSREWRLRMFLAEVLGEMKGAAVVDALIAMLEDRQPEVIREVILSLKKLDDIKAVDGLIDVLEKLEKEKGRPWIEARKALTALTGADYETAQKWREYWLVRKEELKANPETAKPKMDGDMSTSLDEEVKKAPKFFGKEIMSRRIVFVIDTSGSMIMKDRGTGGGEAGDAKKGASEYSKMPKDRMRIERAKNELKKAVAGLPPAAKFNVIAFSSHISPWQKKKLVPANSKNKRAAIAFFDRFSARGGTFTDDALKEAFANMEADTIFFLSDGAPERYPSARGQENPDNIALIDKILNFVRSENKFRKVKIFVFGFDGEGVWDPNMGEKPPYHQKAQRFIDFMKKLANENGGEYKSIK